MNKHFSEEAQMAHKHMKICLKYLSIRKMQIETLWFQKEWPSLWNQIKTNSGVATLTPFYIVDENVAQYDYYVNQYEDFSKEPKSTNIIWLCFSPYSYVSQNAKDNLL